MTSCSCAAHTLRPGEFAIYADGITHTATDCDPEETR